MWPFRKSNEAIPAPQEAEPKGREITDEEASEFSGNEDFETAFTTSLEKDRRDAEKKLLRAGTAIINNPENPGSLMEDKLESRREFIQHGFSFSYAENPYLPPEQRARIRIEGDVNEYFEGAVNQAEDFKKKVGAIKPFALTENTRDTETKLLPKGCKVIVDPTYKELVMEDTPENRATFVKNGGTWKKAEKE